MNKLKEYFSVRKKDTNKYDYGHTLIIGGSSSYLGAAVLAALGANRSGCGLVTLGVPGGLKDLVRVMVLPEIMVCPLPGATREFSPGQVDFLLNWMRERKVNSVGIGPGLGGRETTFAFVSKFLSRIDIPTVVDADALRVFSPLTNKKFSAPLVLTPHTGEISRIFGVTSEEIKKKRLHFAKTLARQTGAIVVLKGYRSLVTDGKEVFVNPTGGPGLARGGSGDVLCGLLAGMLATGKDISRKDILRIVITGVYWHGLAGDIAVKKYTETAMNVSDVISCLPEAGKTLKNWRW